MKKKGSSAAAKGKIKIGELSFTVSSCGLDRAAADRKADTNRDGGNMSRVVEGQGGKYCVLIGPVFKTLKARAASKKSKVSGTKKAGKKAGKRK